MEPHLLDSTLPDTSGKSKFSNMIKGMKVSKYFMFLISQKPLNCVDEQFWGIDHDILEKSILGGSIQFNQVYLFNYKASGDDSEFKKVYAVEEIESIQAKVDSKSFHLKLQMETGKTHIFSFDTAYECLLWLGGLRKALATQDEVLRSNFGVLHYNIRVLYKYHSQGKDAALQEILEQIYTNLDVDAPADQFIEAFESTNKELQFFCDAFFSYQPFIEAVFEVVIKDIHCRIRVILAEFWNRNYMRFSAGEILSFGKLVSCYVSTLTSWGVKDRKFQKIYISIAKTFCGKLFRSSREVLYNVIEDSLILFYKEDSLFMNDSVRILEAHINICFENYEQFSVREMASELIQLSTMMVTLVQTNLITRVQSSGHKLEYEVLVSLVNGNFESLVRNFMKKVHRKSNNVLGLNEIRKMINYNYLQRNNFRMNDIGRKALTNKIKYEIKDVYHSKRTSFLESNFDVFLKEFSLLYIDIFFGLKEEFERNDIVEKLVKEILVIYFEHFMDFAGYINPGNLITIVEKIEHDHLSLLQVIRPIVGKFVDYIINIMVTILVLLSTSDLDKIRISVLKLIAFFGDDRVKIEDVLRLIDTKVYLSDEQHFWLKEEFKLTYYKHQQLMEKKNQLNKYVSPFNLTIRKFVKKIKKKLHRGDRPIERTKTKAFKPSNSECLENRFNAEDIYNFYSSCYLVKFPVNIDESEIESYLSKYIKQHKK